MKKFKLILAIGVLIIISILLFILSKNTLYKNKINYTQNNKIVVGGGFEDGSDIDNNSTKPWVEDYKMYLGSYHLGYSDTESVLRIYEENNKTISSIMSYTLNEQKNEFIPTITELENFSIKNNKFYSDKYNGEFVTFIYQGKKMKGLRIYNYIDNKTDEIGFYSPIK